MTDSVINLRAVERCTFPSAFSSNKMSFDIQLFHRTLSVVCNSSEQGENQVLVERVSCDSLV